MVDPSKEDAREYCTDNDTIQILSIDRRILYTTKNECNQSEYSTSEKEYIMVLSKWWQTPPYTQASFILATHHCPPGVYDAHSNLQVSIVGSSSVYKELTFLSPLVSFHYHILLDKIYRNYDQNLLT